VCTYAEYTISITQAIEHIMNIIKNQSKK